MLKPCRIIAQCTAPPPPPPPQKMRHPTRKLEPTRSSLPTPVAHHLTKKHQSLTVWPGIFASPQKKNHTAETPRRWVPENPSTIFLATSFFQDIPECSIPYFLNFHASKYVIP